MNPGDTYTDLPHPHGDAVRDGRQLMNGDYDKCVQAWLDHQQALGVGHVTWQTGLAWFQVNV